MTPLSFLLHGLGAIGIMIIAAGAIGLLVARVGTR